MRIKLQPASATDLPAYNPILPAAAITQVMLIALPVQVQSCAFLSSYMSVSCSLPEIHKSLLVTCFTCTWPHLRCDVDREEGEY